MFWKLMLRVGAGDLSDRCVLQVCRASLAALGKLRTFDASSSASCEFEHDQTKPRTFSQGRGLQQSTGPCTLSFGSNQLNFAACRNLKPTLGADYNLLYTVTSAAAGQPGSVLHGAIDAASLGWPTFWAGFGIPVTPCRMLGGSAMIVQSCSTCPSGKPQEGHCILAMLQP